MSQVKGMHVLWMLFHVLGAWTVGSAFQTQEGPVVLFADDFERNTQASTGQTAGRWFVLFRGSHGTKEGWNNMENVWTDMAEAWKKKGTIFACADLEDKKGALAKRFGIQSTTALYFAEGVQYEYQGGATQDEVEAFLKGGYKDAKVSKVPPPLNLWDELWMDKLAPALSTLKELTNQKLSLMELWKLWILSGVCIVVGIGLGARMLR